MAVDFSHKTAWDLEKLEPNTFFPVPASVVFAKRLGEDGRAKPLAGRVERWLGKAGANDVRRELVSITDTSVVGKSPYAGLSRNGATIFPRCLFFVEETDNPAIVQAGQTITVNPRRGPQGKNPWKTLDLTAISEQTIESAHVFNVHLGETVVPYATLDPLKAILPLRQGESELPTDDDGVGGIRLGGLSQRMRGRWRTVSGLWDANKSASNRRRNLLGQLDYYSKLSSQLEWQSNPEDRPVRIVHTKSGQPTAAILHQHSTLVENVLFWIPCKDTIEANYLLAIINSDALSESAMPLMSKGQFGARDLHKHLWKLPIPAFDPNDPRHVAISDAGETAAKAAARQLTNLRQQRARVTVTIARRELRKWLRESAEGAAVEAAVGELLASA